jgi:oligoribonuclease NrnB/cAMP/cGMP phosphodiesterase (DHH superfamily)
MTLKQAETFLRSIKPKDKVALLFHDDLDGFASGVLLYDYLTQEKNCNNIRTFPFNLANFDMEFSGVQRSLEDRTRIIIADLAPNVIKNALGQLNGNKSVLYIDHHQKKGSIPKKIVEYRITAKYTPCSSMVYGLTGGKEWLAVAGVVSDAGDKYPENREFIDSFLRKINMGLDEYKEKVVNPISDGLIYFKKDKNSGDAFGLIRDIKNWGSLGRIQKYSKIVESEINKFTGDFEKQREQINGINFYLFKSRFDILPILIGIMSDQNPSGVYVFASPMDHRVRLSARNQSGEIDMIQLLEKSIEGLNNATCGGHKAAAGGNIGKKDLTTFKENLKKFKY